jgi:hypothetical protein
MLARPNNGRALEKPGYVIFLGDRKQNEPKVVDHQPEARDIHLHARHGARPAQELASSDALLCRLRGIIPDRKSHSDIAGFQ